MSGYAVQNYNTSMGGCSLKPYADIAAQLVGRCKNSRKVGNHTYLKRRGDGTVLALALHATDVITWTLDGRVVLDSGGWRTVTTKARMNEYGARVSQEANVWYLRAAGVEYVYADGVTLDGDTVTGADVRTDTADRERNKQNRATSRFVRDYVAAFLADDIPKPSNGDCWGCLMTTAEGAAPMGGTDHIQDHITESYFVPSLLLRAVAAFPVSPVVGSVIHATWYGGKNPGEWVRGVAKNQLTSSLRRWVRRELDGGVR